VVLVYPVQKDTMILVLALIGLPVTISTTEKRICPPSKTGIGRRFKMARFKLTKPSQ